MKNSLKILVLVALLSLSSCISLSARTMQMSKIDSLSMRVANMEHLMAEEQQKLELCKKELSICEISLHSIDEHVDRTNETISNQISSSSHIISTWGIIFSIISILLTAFGVVFGFYINRMWRKISDLQENAQRLMKDFDQKEPSKHEIETSLTKYAELHVTSKAFWRVKKLREQYVKEKGY